MDNPNEEYLGFIKSLYCIAHCYFCLQDESTLALVPANVIFLCEHKQKSLDKNEQQTCSTSVSKESSKLAQSLLFP